MDYKGKTKKREIGILENAPSASAIGGEYEVFLSFTGDDTREGFADYLYNNLVDAGIRTFRDDGELRVGEEIGPELKKAIEESKICIPIFSQNYASSKWCLLELAQMVECKRSTRQKILPIFYNVEPRDVRKQTGSYGEAFQQHEKEKRFNKETVQEWREALREVGELKGWELEKKTDGYGGELVKIVVLEVLSQLKKNYMVVPDNLVGIDHHVGEMKRLLNVDSNDVRIVGICGMGGLGKTTIAKFVYNELSECFDCCCFLADVREKAHQDSGLVELQKLLISKIRKGKSPDIPTVDEGINMIEGMACKKKVLIVLDDVDNESQFAKLVGKCNQFGSGSRIIVTTRNKGVLNVFEVATTYEPNLMKPDHALQLFSRHAFRSDFPSEDYDFLSKNIVSITGGLPLALEIIGSLLFNKCEEVWEVTLEKLKDIPHDQVQKQLRISYDALGHEEKQIFLDIACFFTGENKTLPFYMWNDCKYNPKEGINILVLRSLVKIGDDDKFRMHDQLRDLGREIVLQESIEDPGKRSRLWSYGEALDILDRQMGTYKVKALCLQTYREIGWPFRSREHSLTNNEFGELQNLRFLRVDGACLTGDFNNLLSRLRWLQWRMCTDNSKPINFHLKNLVILDLSCSFITENWEGWSQIKMAKKLKVLNLSFCDGLTITPDFSTFVSLERLFLKRCGNLIEIGPSIGNLINLRELDISGSGIIRLPDAIGGLEKLEEINASDCHHFVGVSPSNIGRLSSLRILNMRRCISLERLPDLSNMGMLKILNLSQCEKLVEVRGLTALKSLEKLNMRRCISLERLPDLSNMGMLKILNLSWCGKLVEVRGLTGLKSLERLNLSGCNLFEGLLDVSNLKNLKKLEIRGWKNLTEVQGLEELESLEILDISECRLLEKSLDLSNLQKLKELKAGGCENLPEIRGLKELKSLTFLDISGCKAVEKLLGIEELQNLSDTEIVRDFSKLRLEYGTEFDPDTDDDGIDYDGHYSRKALEKLPNLSNTKVLTDTLAARIREKFGLKYYLSDSDPDPDSDSDDY